MKKYNKNKVFAFLLSFSLLFCVSNRTFAQENDTSTNVTTGQAIRMEKVDEELEVNIEAINNNENGNKYPIVLVHGLFGWGNDELMGVNYWGGSESLREKLTSKGYEVYTPTIGPVASNWDRACELYAYLKGGIVDYGEAHSKKYGHSRYGRNFEGVYPKLGTMSDNNEIQKVHLVGHSMGGQTVRTLVQLLENGNKEEITATPKEELSPLFTGGKSWVCSVTSIATPHDGSPAAHEKYDLEPFVHQLVAALAVKSNVKDTDNLSFDYRLDQWGLKREPNESYEDYFNKVMNSNIWKETNDLSVWDLAPEGARELNTWVKAQQDIYYFSIACIDTHESIITHHQVPDKNMDPILVKSAYLIGKYENNTPGEVKVDKTWWKNDGVVSLISAISPNVGSADKAVKYNGTPQKGVWNYLGANKSIDHIEVVGQFKYGDILEKQFFDLAKMLTSLHK